MSAALEVATVFRDGEAAFIAHYGRTLRSEQRQALRAVIRCRTAELGGHVQRCEACGQQRIQYNSCRNRHCPKCQALARAAWLQKRESELLPVPYFHVVFTLPHPLAPLALQNQRVVYGLLFQAAARTLVEVAANPRHLGARVGCLMVLPTWGQNLMHHPHVHTIVTGGGLSPDGSRWIDGKRSQRRRPFFAPVKVLSRVFRGKFIPLLKQAFAAGRLAFHGQLQPLGDPAIFEQRLNHAVRHDWVVYTKRPFASPTCVLKYLARYTHGVAISNRRLVALRDGQVSFRYKDYADQQQSKVLTLQTPEFIRRFLLHTLPRGFVRIRYYGFLANRQRNEQLEHCRRLLGVTPEPTPVAEEKALLAEAPHPRELCRKCPACQHGKLVIIEVVSPVPRLPPRRPHILTSRAALAQPLDST
jgi:putative transposase/transposase-like zinc-binding protein